MSAATPECDVQREEVSSVRTGEEACRRKIVALREGLRDVCNSRGVSLGQGASNDDMLSSMAQLCGKPPARYLERLDISWKKEYASMVQIVGCLVGEDRFTADTEPMEVIQMVQSQYAPDEKRGSSGI